MNIASTLKVLVLATFSLIVAASASAQLAPPHFMPSPTLLMPAQSLEPTIKVHPTPEVKPGKPAVIVREQCVCTMQYDPVCGRTRDGYAATYSNACKARCAGATVIVRGAC